MAGFQARQPWLNISLVTAGLGCFLSAPTLGWGWAIVAGLAAIPLVFGTLLGVAFIVSRLSDSNSKINDEGD